MLTKTTYITHYTTPVLFRSGAGVIFMSSLLVSYLSLSDSTSCGFAVSVFVCFCWGLLLVVLSRVVARTLSFSSSMMMLFYLFVFRGCWISSSLSELFVCASVLSRGLGCTFFASILLASFSSLSDSTLKHLWSVFSASCGMRASPEQLHSLRVRHCAHAYISTETYRNLNQRHSPPCAPLCSYVHAFNWIFSSFE